MLDPNFSTTVTLICEHNDEGALGIVINRPTTLKLSGLFEQLSVEDPDPEAASSLCCPVDPLARNAALSCMGRSTVTKTRWLYPTKFG